MIGGWSDFVAGFEGLNGYALTVGIHQEDDEVTETGATIVEYATYSEFGTEDIPARPFLQSTAQEQKDRWATLSGQLFGRVLDGKLLPRTALDALGTRAAADVKRKIVTLREPPNAPATIARKGSSNPLIDTNRMRAAIKHVVHRGSIMGG